MPHPKSPSAPSPLGHPSPAALAARRGSRRTRMNALEHGLFVREFSPATLRRLGEDPQEFRELYRLLRRVFVPREPPETELVAMLAAPAPVSCPGLRRARLAP